jgi:hypothetical protein
MQISGFIWLPEIVEKLLQKHGVRQAEVRELFAPGAYFIFVEGGTGRARISTLSWGRPTQAGI